MEEKNLIILRASAGSGKTFRLTTEFLKIVLKQRSIYSSNRFYLPFLAVTFTNKAAYEMKERFIAALYELYTEREKSRYYKYIQDANNVSFEDIYTSLLSILHNYHELQVSTLDHFFNRLFRTFSHELSMSGTYEIELDDDEIKRYLVEEFFIHHLHKNDDYKRFLMKIMENLMDDDTDPFSLKNDFIKKLNLIFQDERAEFFSGKLLDLSKASEFYADLYDYLGKKLDELMKKLHDTAENFEKFIYEHSNNFSKLKKNETNIKEKVLKNLPKIKQVASINLEELCDQKRCNQLMQKTYLVDSEVKETLAREFSKQFLSIISLMLEYRWYKSMRKSLPMLVLLPTFVELYEEYKRKKNILHISEINLQVASLLEKYSVPFIYEYLDTKVQHIFIDEFQDTSYLQFKNFIPLLENVLANKGYVVLVGDIKQSLYRFRNGDYEIMYHLPKFYSKYNTDTALNEVVIQSKNELIDFSQKTNWEKKQLTENYRSYKTLVDFNNNIYSFDHTEENGISLHGVFADVKQKETKAEEGWVKIHFFYDGDQSKNESKEKWMEQVREEIEHIRDKYHCRLGDIAILLRRNNQILSLSSYLRKNGIEVVSPGLFQFKASPHVRLIMASWGYLLCPDDKITEQEIRIFCKKIGLKDEQTENYLKTELQGLKNLRNFLPVDFIELILSLQAGEEPLWKTGGYFVSFLREEIYKLQSRGVVTLKAVWDWWQNEGREKKVPTASSPHKVKIMTIHSSKGLEFPFVLLPKFDEIENKRYTNSKDKFWFLWKHEDQKLPLYNDYLSFDLHESLYSQESRGTQEELKGWLKEVFQRKKYEDTLTEIDKMALSYVATTRAKYGMTIFVGMTKDEFGKLQKDKNNKEQNKNEKEENSFAKDKKYILYKMWEYAKAHGTLKEKENRCEFFLGNEAIQLDSSSSQEGKEDLVPCSFSNFSYALRESVQENSSILTLAAIHRGEIIHELFQQIYSPRQIESILRAYWSEGKINEEDVAKIKELLEKEFVEACDEAAFVLNERSIAMNKKNIRPDKVLLHDNQAIVYEYKTGLPRSEYEGQLDEYVRQLKAMGFTTIKKLLYLPS
jgi:ATP-dependent exoDNAse (exonuclease V) beta subunit